LNNSIRDPKSKARGHLFIVSAPSGAGKTTLCRRIIDYFDDILFSVSYTTRPPRHGEKDGVDYHFVREDRFDEMIKKDEFIEWAIVHHKSYGTVISDLNSSLDRGYDVILDIDVQGAKQVKSNLNSAVYVFILPPSISACADRLKKRGKNSHEDIARRIVTAKAEIKQVDMYDYIIINDDIEKAFEIFKSIIIAERSKQKYMRHRVNEITACC